MATDVALTAPPPRAHLIERIRPRLHELVRAWQLLAEDVLGAEARIDFVGVEPAGRVVVVLVGEEGEDLALVGRALAQRSWVALRIRDWIQLAPTSGIRPGGGVRAVLLGPRFSTETVAAANALGPELLTLARYTCIRTPAGVEVLLEALDPGAAAREPITAAATPATAAIPAASAAPPREPAPPPPFRSGLHEEDLELTAIERAELGADLEP